MDSSSDSEYLPSGCCSSEEDEEAVEIKAKLMEFKKKVKSGDLENLDGAISAYAHVNETDQLDGCGLEDGNSASSGNSSDQEDESFEALMERLLGKETIFPGLTKRLLSLNLI